MLTYLSSLLHGVRGTPAVNINHIKNYLLEKTTTHRQMSDHNLVLGWPKTLLPFHINSFQFFSFLCSYKYHLFCLQCKRETRIRRHNLGIKAKQVAMVWACVAKRRQWLGEEMYEV